MKLRIMKKFTILACMIACIFGLTACGSGETLEGYEKEKSDYAKQVTTGLIIPVLQMYMDDQLVGYYDGLTMEEVEYYAVNQHQIEADGYGFVSAVKSFQTAKESIGEIKSIGEATASVKGNEIVVEVEITGEKKNAVAEVVLSNDMFMRLKSASLNPVSSTGELMLKAALNTLIGMGIVFVVLILISMIISCFRVIPKIQNASAEKKAAKQAAVQKEEPVKQEQVAEQAAPEEEDNLELAAVIAAAIAASEGAAAPDGFVVRSIIRRA